MRVAKHLAIMFLFVGFLISCVTSDGVSMFEMPNFYLKPPSNRFRIYGVGEAKMSTAAMSRTVAIARARDDVARQVRISVRNAITDYAQESGEERDATTVRFAEAVSRQTADVALTMVKTEKLVPTRNGTFYALVSYPVKNMMADAKVVFERNRAAAFAEFRADQALDRLTGELRSNPTEPGVDR